MAEKQGVSPEDVTGTTQNDILKEYTARGTYIYPPKPSMRIITDLFAYCRDRATPVEHDIDLAAITCARREARPCRRSPSLSRTAIAYVQAAIDAGLDVDDFAPRLSFFFACHMNFFEEVAKFRAARRLWARDHEGAVRGEGRDGR